MTKDRRGTDFGGIFMTSSARAELISIQKKLWRWNKELIDHSVLVKEPDFDSYERSYVRATRDYARVSNHDEMLEVIHRSNNIYVGDYHTCNQSQRSFLRILKSVIKDDDNFIIGMELIHARYQKVLDSYLSGRISEPQFLKRVKLKEHWVFDLWDNFKPIFDFCRYHNIRMFAIDAAEDGSDVRTRDASTARLIASVIEKDPSKKLFVFIGDLHISPSHLPSLFQREMKKRSIKRNDLILYQNVESIYWKLADKGIEHRVEIVRMPDGNFCRMHTPPVICQRSYLNWLEHEEGEIDYADARSQFIELVDRICEFLKLNVGDAKDEVEVFTSGDLGFLRYLRKKYKFSAKEITAVKNQILANESYYISKAKIAYLANLSINHAAEEASHFIKSVCSGPEIPRNMFDAFYANALHEALGFFGSKLINNRRKCYHEKDFGNLLDYFKTIRVPSERKLEYETAHLVTEYKKLERTGFSMQNMEIFKGRMDLFMSITHALGYILGDRMYYGLMGQVIRKPYIKKLFLDSWHDEGRPFDVYMDLVGKLKKVKIPKRM